MPEEITNEQVFSEVYHSLIHSSTLQTLLNLEHTYAFAVANMIKRRDDDLEEIKERYKISRYPFYTKLT